jgi:hypothetical protein
MLVARQGRRQRAGRARLTRATSASRWLNHCGISPRADQAGCACCRVPEPRRAARRGTEIRSSRSRRGFVLPRLLRRAGAGAPPRALAGCGSCAACAALQPAAGRAARGGGGGGLGCARLLRAGAEAPEGSCAAAAAGRAAHGGGGGGVSFALACCAALAPERPRLTARRADKPARHCRQARARNAARAGGRGLGCSTCYLVEGAPG